MGLMEMAGQLSGLGENSLGSQGCLFLSSFPVLANY